MNSEKHFVLSLATKTWCRDSHGLYDYESNQTKNTNALVADNVIIARRKHEIRTVTNMEDIKDDELLLIVKFDKNDKYFLLNQVPSNLQPTEKNINDLSNKIWYVIKHDESANSNSIQNFINTNEDYHLCQNDIVKLGRVKYALNEVNFPNLEDASHLQADLPFQTGVYNASGVNIGTKPVFDFIYKTSTPPEGSQEDMCKICLANSNEESNPLVTLCKCIGGIHFSHYECLKRWMQTKLVKKENEKKTVTSYNIKSFNCEICKTPYPFRFQIANREQIFDLIDIVRPEGKNYIILESLNQMKDNNNIKSIHVISLDESKINIGRGHESDVRINDISVSRSHACLNFDPYSGKIWIRDLKSKFGTLVLFKNPIMIKDKKIHLQIGRTYVDANLISFKDYEKLKLQKEKKHSSNPSVNNANANKNIGTNNANNSQSNVAQFREGLMEDQLMNGAPVNFNFEDFNAELNNDKKYKK